MIDFINRISGEDVSSETSDIILYYDGPLSWIAWGKETKNPFYIHFLDETSDGIFYLVVHLMQEENVQLLAEKRYEPLFFFKNCPITLISSADGNNYEESSIAFEDIPQHWLPLI